MTEHTCYIYEHRCPPAICARVGQRVTVYPHIRDGVAHLSRLVCVESGNELYLTEQVIRES